jgi:glycosyltransferase involved in cell wall biosynthesis
VSAGKIEVSVVLPTRDRWQLAQDALESALGQQRVRLEVCVVDDGSVTPAPSGFADDPRVRLFRHPRPRGVATSRNHAIAEARGMWIAFLDDDDVWAPTHVQRLLDAVREHDACWAFSGYVMTTLRRAPIGNGPLPAVEPDPVRQFLRTNAVGTPSCALVASETLRDVGGFDEHMSVMADWDLWLKLAIGGRPALSPAFTVGYAQHGGNMSLDMDRVHADWAYIASRYKKDLERLDLVFADNEYFWRWLAFGHARGGRQWLAARFLVRAAIGGGGGRDIVRAIGLVPVIGWPIRLRRLIIVAVDRRPRLGRAPPTDDLWLHSLARRSPGPSSGPARAADRISQWWRVRTRPSP